MYAFPQNPKDVVTKLVEMVMSTGDTHASMLAAFGDERTAQATCITALVELLRPALPALVTPMTIDTSNSTGWLNEQKLVTATLYQLGVAPSYGGNRGGNPRLFVDASGALFWTHPEKHVLEATTAEVVSEAAIWPVEKWVANVWTDLENAMAGNMKKTTIKAEDRAERLKAIAVLLDVNNRFNVPEKKEGVDHRATT